MTSLSSSIIKVFLLTHKLQHPRSMYSPDFSSNPICSNPWQDTAKVDKLLELCEPVQDRLSGLSAWWCSLGELHFHWLLGPVHSFASTISAVKTSVASSTRRAIGIASCLQMEPQDAWARNMTGSDGGKSLWLACTPHYPASAHCHPCMTRHACKTTVCTTYTER